MKTDIILPLHCHFIFLLKFQCSLFALVDRPFSIDYLLDCFDFLLINQKIFQNFVTCIPVLKKPSQRRARSGPGHTEENRRLVGKRLFEHGIQRDEDCSAERLSTPRAWVYCTHLVGKYAERDEGR